jgi:hypothetical protein
MLDLTKEHELFHSKKASRFFEIVVLEKPVVFDYVFRMTGDINAALYGMEIGYQKMPKEQWASLGAFRVALYSSIRKVLVNEWGQDVSMLENEAINSVLTNSKTGVQIQRKMTAFRRLDRALGLVSSERREALILHIRSEFTLSEISQITDWDRQRVERNYHSCLDDLKRRVEDLPKDPRQVLASLHYHPIPRQVDTVPTDLNHVMGGIRRGQAYRGIRSSGLILTLIVIIGASFALHLMNPALSQSILRKARAFAKPYLSLLP